MQSRYYNPEWGRFINADGIVGQTGELLGHNLFAYSKNNPVNMHDDGGFRPDDMTPDDYMSSIMSHLALSELNSSIAGIKSGVKQAIESTFGSWQANVANGGAAYYGAMKAAQKTSEIKNQRLEHMINSGNYTNEKIASYKESIDFDVNISKVKGAGEGVGWGIVALAGINFIDGFGKGFYSEFKREMSSPTQNVHIWDTK